MLYEQVLTENVGLVGLAIGKIQSYSRANIEEIRSSVHISLWNACNTYDESKSAFSTYFINVAIWDWSKDHRKKQLPEGCGIEREQAENHNFTVDYDNADQVTELLNRLSPDDKQIMIWRYFEDMGLREIGQKLGMSGEAVRQKICKILSKLKKTRL